MEHRVFNRKLAEFMEDLKPVVGHLPEYSMLSTSVALMSAVAETKNQEIFDQFFCKPYEAHIMAKDESFFVQSSFEEYSNQGIIPLLKAAWASLSSSDKDAVWAHLQVLVILNRRCYEKK